MIDRREISRQTSDFSSLLLARFLNLEADLIVLANVGQIQKDKVPFEGGIFCHWRGDRDFETEFVYLTAHCGIYSMMSSSNIKEISLEVARYAGECPPLGTRAGVAVARHSRISRDQG